MGSPSKEKGKRRLLGFVFSFGYEKGAACLPRLGGWCLIFRFWLDKVSRGQRKYFAWHTIFVKMFRSILKIQ